MKLLRYRFGLAALSGCVCVLFACNNNSDYKSNDNDSSNNISKESAIAAQSNVDTAAMNNGGSTAPPVTDTSTTQTVNTTAASTKTGMAKPNPAKKGHKGSVRMAVHAPGYTAKIEADKEGVYNFTEVQPVFPGGEKELDKFIETNIQYPQDALENGVEGTVTVVFAINEKGKVFAPKLKDAKLGYGLDEEAMEAVRKMPRWTPGRVKGKDVKSYYSLPITFTLAD